MKKGRPCLEVHPEPVPDRCPVCRKYLTSEVYRRRWDGTDRCPHLGDELDGPARQALGLSHARRWHECGKGHGAVCVCGTYKGKINGCRGCPDYEPGSRGGGEPT